MFRILYQANLVYIRIATATLPHNLIEPFLENLSLPQNTLVISSKLPAISSSNRCGYVIKYDQKSKATSAAIDLLRDHRREEADFKALVIGPSKDCNYLY